MAAVPSVSHDALPLSVASLVGALVVQIAVGALMGFVVQLFVGAVQGAGSMIDQFSGLNLPPAIDPLSLDQSPLLAQIYEWMATVLDLRVGGLPASRPGLCPQLSPSSARRCPNTTSNSSPPC